MEWYKEVINELKKYADELTNKVAYTEVRVKWVPNVRHGIFYGDHAVGLEILFNQRGKITHDYTKPHKRYLVNYLGNEGKTMYSALAAFRELYSMFGLDTTELDEKLNDLSKLLNKNQKF